MSRTHSMPVAQLVATMSEDKSLANAGSRAIYSSAEVEECTFFYASRTQPHSPDDDWCFQSRYLVTHLIPAYPGSQSRAVRNRPTRPRGAPDVGKRALNTEIALTVHFGTLFELLLALIVET